MPSDELAESSSNYGEILLDRSLLFHGIGFDFARLKGILHHGILSEDEARQRGVRFIRNYDGFNLANTVSVAKPPSIHNTFTNQAFNTYISNGISFIISGMKVEKDTPRRYSALRSIDDELEETLNVNFDDEAFVKDYIPLENITGIMAPHTALSKPISELPLVLQGTGIRYIDIRCRAMISFLQVECGFIGDTSSLRSFVERMNNLTRYHDVGVMNEVSDIVSQIDNFMRLYISRAYDKLFQKENATLRDVLRYYVPPGMRFFNSRGIPMDL